MNMTKQDVTGKLTAMDDYINKVYKLVLLLVPGMTECAGLLYTLAKVFGWIPSVSWRSLIIFDVTCILYLIIGIYFIRTGIKNGVVIEKKLKEGKLFLVVLLLIQYNFILYMIPATDFWGFSFFFVILSAFFLDCKLVTVTAIEIAGSTVLAWFLNGDIALPLKNTYFMPNMLDRVSCLTLSLSIIVLLTYLIKRFLLTAYNNELERNTKQIKTVLGSVQSLSKNLFSAEEALSKIAESEKNAMSKLSNTSEQLLTGSNLLDQKTEGSMSNLQELSQWENMVADNVEKVKETSGNLLNKSKENEVVLNDLQKVNDEVTVSMQTTTKVAEQLSEAVQEIGVTLNLINEISTSTNLLALNASIESARAGEAGKGFAVVAAEVGNLANSTQESLQQVEKVIARVQNSMEQINLHIQENSQKLEQQNGYFNHVFSGMQDMTELLGIATDAVNTMMDAHNKQAAVMKDTVTINQDIAENIKQENEQFVSINEMVESNVNDIAKMTEQADVIHWMVDEMNLVLEVIQEK